ncbi:hypothetical protein [Sinorhizobium fredii]|uniref:hypothetical protein n=1 Tax=Rhizobium fredii TaxID=380 RepID=UPI001FCAAE80|nr:hypothetical protein [Sinorhizobium fredii]
MVKAIWTIKEGRIVHRNLGAEAAMPEIGPVADLAVADADEVGQPVTAHVGEVEGVCAIGQMKARALLLNLSLMKPARRTEAGFGERGMPAERLLLGDKDVDVSVPVEIDKAHVRALPVELGKLAK